MGLKVVEEQSEPAPEERPDPAVPWWAGGPVLVLLVATARLLLEVAWSGPPRDGAIPPWTVLEGAMVVVLAGWSARLLSGGTIAQLVSALAALSVPALWTPSGSATLEVGLLLAAVIGLVLARRFGADPSVLLWLLAVPGVLVTSWAPDPTLTRVPWWPPDGLLESSWLLGPLQLVLLAVGVRHGLLVRRERSARRDEGGSTGPAGILLHLPLAALAAAILVLATGGGTGVYGLLSSVAVGVAAEQVAARQAHRIVLLALLLGLILQVGVLGVWVSVAG